MSSWRKYQLYSAVLSSFKTRITVQSYSLGWGWEVVKDRDSLRACLHGSGGPQVGEVTRLST